MSKIIVITGAGAGLGRALARRFAADGDKVVLLGRTLSKVKELAAELGEPAMAVACDVGSPDSVRTAFATIAKRYPKIDVLINNAAVYQPFLIADATDEQILGSVQTNLAGPIFCVRSALPLLDRGGHIINVSSESVAMRFPYLVMYRASKAGLERFSEGLQNELQPHGVRVTTVRAGKMMEEGKAGLGVTQEVAMAFAKACAEAGFDLRSSPISHVNSVPGVFRLLIDMPEDLQIQDLNLQAWR